MKTFRSLVVLKRPREELWAIMRDHLVDFAANIGDIQEIRLIERKTGSDGIVQVVNEWRMHQRSQAMICSMLKIEQLSWIDRNSWNPATDTCSWSIEPSFLTDFITCSGETAFSDAMAGRGTRIAFAGALDLKPGLLGSLGSMEPTLSGLLEAIVTTIIPRNLRAVAEAAAAFEPPLNGT